MKRRNFLKHTAHGLIAPGVMGSLGLPFGSTASALKQNFENADGRVLVIIFLDGGNDGLNTVVPYAELSRMHDIRPHVVLQDGDLRTLLGTGLGLHPSLSGMQSLYHEGRLKIVQSVGYPEPNYSHFRSSDIWMSGSDSNVNLTSGWMGRSLSLSHPEYPHAYPNNEHPDPLALELGYGSSLLFQSPAATMGMVISGPNSFYELIDDVATPVPENAASEKLEYIQLIQRQSQQYGAAIKRVAQNVGNNHVEYPESDIAQQLKIVSKMIAGGLQTPVYMVRLAGFDTHDAQVVPGNPTIGEHATLLRELDQAIMAFTADLEHHNTADRVVGMTFSEFGRTVYSNASNGTDHGTAAPMFFFGNAVSGGLLGDNVHIPSGADWTYDLPMEYDFRQLYASILQQWLNIENGSIENALLGSFDTLPIIGAPDGIVGTGRSLPSKLMAYPNPVKDVINVSLRTTGEQIQISLHDLNGRKLDTLYNGKSNAGQTLIHWPTHDLPKGQYIIISESKFGKQIFKIVK